MKKIQISTDGNSALLAGGVNTHEVVNTLAVKGKVTGENISCIDHLLFEPPGGIDSSQLLPMAGVHPNLVLLWAEVSGDTWAFSA